MLDVLANGCISLELHAEGFERWPESYCTEERYLDTTHFAQICLIMQPAIKQRQNPAAHAADMRSPGTQPPQLVAS